MGVKNGTYRLQLVVLRNSFCMEVWFLWYNIDLKGNYHERYCASWTCESFIEGTQFTKKGKKSAKRKRNRKKIIL